MRLLPVALCAALLALPACHKPDPNSVEDQVKVLKTGKTTKIKERACDNLRKIGKKEAVPGLIEALPTANAKIKGEIAQVLGELKDPSAVSALAEAIDLSVGQGTDRMTEEGNTANKWIARAIGDLGGKDAVKPLMQLLKATRNDYVRIEAISALGKLKDPAAVPLLSDIGTDERLEPFVAKKAILALSQINHPDALPVYLKMAFAERKGLSFYPESSLGVFLLGDAAKDKVLALLKDEDKEFIAWAKERQVLLPALYAKAAQMEADLQDKRAIEPLIKLLKFEDPDLMIKLTVRMTAASTLGSMRAKEAISAIAAQLGEEEANTRSAYVRALVQIGDRSVLPKLVDCAKNGSWSAREFCVLGLVQLGGEKELGMFDGFAKAEPARFDKECNDGIYGDVDCPKERAANVEARTKLITAYKKALETIVACKDDHACLEGALSHTDAVVRERAAYELGRRGASGSVPALMAAIKRPVNDVVDLNPRFAAICAVDWITAADPKAMAAAKGDINALHAQVEQEKGKRLTMKIAEEVMRLAAKLEKGNP